VKPSIIAKKHVSIINTNVIKNMFDGNRVKIIEKWGMALTSPEWKKMINAATVVRF